MCNPQLITSCVYPEECLVTPYNNYRCACPEGYSRDYRTGFCGEYSIILLTGELLQKQRIWLFTAHQKLYLKLGIRLIRVSNPPFSVSVKEVHIFPQHDADCHNGGQRCGQNEYCASDRAGHWFCECLAGFERSQSTGQCSYPGTSQC